MNYPVPNTVGYKKEAAIKKLESEYKVETKEVEDTSVPFGCVSSYQIFDSEEKVVLYVAAPYKNSYSHDERVASVRNLGPVTGKSSPNAGLLLGSGATATDLGIPVPLDNGRIAYLYGDTFSGGALNRGIWNSNFMAIADDVIPHSGIRFTDLYRKEDGSIRPLIQGEHCRNLKENLDGYKGEVTKIPTGGIVVNGSLYAFYMSISYWGVAGEWIVRHSSVLKSDPNHLELHRFEPLTFDISEGQGLLGQIFPFLDEKEPDYVMFLCTGGGRIHKPILMRVPKDRFEDKGAYELRGLKDWVPINKSDGVELYHPLNVAIAEPSVMYDRYLGKWMICNLEDGGMYLRLSESLYEPFEERIKLFDGTNMHAFYGGFLHEHLSSDSGRKLYLQISEYDPIYNTSLLEVTFK